jgi:3-methyladenine DNA glycosylase AlkD
MKARSQSLSTPKKPFKPRIAIQRAATAWTVRSVLDELKRHGKKKNVQGFEYFGIRAKKAFGVSTPDLRRIARKIGKNHTLGLRLWQTGVHDARHLAALVCDPELVTASHMENWVKQFDSWDLCDGPCCHLFVDARPAWSKALTWTTRKKEFEKRAGFALAAYLAVHDKEASDAKFRPLLKAIEREAWDERNFVKKAVNWALRQIGKRNARLNREAITAAGRIQNEGTRAGRWIAADALRELTSERVQKRLRQKEN